MTLTMYYVRGMRKKEEWHTNVPAANPVEAFSIFKAHNGEDVIVTQITPLFQYEHEEEKKLVEVN